MKTKERDSLVDLLKGIGIISVVIGHSGVLFPRGDFLISSKFVYLYHLMVFFFVAGITYKPQKYRDPYLYMGRQLKSSLPLYVQYNFVLLLLHNTLAKLQVLDMPIYTTVDQFVKVLSICTMTHLETLCGALWFVPMFLIAKAFFAVGFQASERLHFPIIGHLFVICITAYMGVYLNYRDVNFIYHIQTSVLGVPVIYLGYVFNLIRNKLPAINKCFNPVTCILSAIMMVWFLRLGIGEIELSANQIISPRLFYPVTGLGIIFCLCLANTLNHWKPLKTLVKYTGSISFHIMAQHFIVFKAFDLLYGRLIHADAQTMMLFPTSFYGMGLIYTILGITIPTTLVFLVRQCKARFSPKNTHTQQLTS